MKTPIFERCLPFIIIASLTSAVYFNSLYAAFQFDDMRTIVKNPDIKILFTGAGFNFFSRPVLFATLKINYYFGEMNTFGYHLINVILHICISSLIYLIVSKIGRDNMRGLPLLSSLIFALHPINTEAVTYIISRSILLSTFFGLLTLLFFVKGMEAIERMQDARCKMQEKRETRGEKRGTRDEGRGTKRSNKLVFLSSFIFRPSSFLFLISGFCFILALGSREDAVILPVLIALYYLFFLKPREKNIIVFFIILILLTAYPLARYIFTGNIGVSEVTKFTPLTYLITEINVIVYYYIKMIILPFNLNVDPDIEVVSNIDISTILAIALIVFIFFLFRKSRILIFSLLWFFIAIAPTSSIIPLLDAAAEHRVYLSMVGGAILISGCLLKLKAQSKKLPLIPIYFIIVFFSIGVMTRNYVWRSELSLWDDTVKKSPFKSRVYNALGLAYKREKGDYEKSLLYYNKALSILPLYADARINKGVIFTLKGDFEEALKEFNIALTLKPNSPQLHNNMGVIYIKKGDMDRAVKEFQSALKIDPKFEEARKNLQSIQGKHLMGQLPHSP